MSSPWTLNPDRCFTPEPTVRDRAGFDDDTRAFASIPARHDVWRRTVANWPAGTVERGLVDADDAEMAHWLAYGAAMATYGIA